MTRPGPDDPIVIDSATGEWLPGDPSPSLLAAGRGHAWQMIEGIWRLAEPEDDEEAVYRAVRAGRGSMLCIGDGCRRTRELPSGVGYICAEHMAPTGVDMSTGLAKVADDAGTPPAPTDPARSRRKEPEMPRSLAATDAPMTNAGSPENKAAIAREAAKGRAKRAAAKTAVPKASELLTGKRSRPTAVPTEDLGPVVNPDGTPTETTTGILTGMRHCIGAPRFGIAPHEAPVTEFGKHNRGPGGLSRMCRPDWKVYAKALAAEKAGTSTTVVTESAPSAPRLRPVTPEQAEKATRVRKARATLAAIDALPGPEAVAAIGTDEAQDALAVAAEASLGTRGESEADED